MASGQKYVRKNSRLLPWARCAAFALATLVALLSVHFEPKPVAAGLALLAGGLGYLAAELGVLVAILSLSLALVAANPVVGIVFLILGVVSIRYLGGDGGRVFLLVTLAVIGAFFGPVWATAALAGFLLGAGEGALAAGLACLSIELLGLLLGRPSIGVTLTGGHGASVLNFSAMPDSLLAFGWIREAFKGVDNAAVDRFISSIAGLRQPLALILQPAVWSFAALAAGYLRSGRTVKNSAVRALIAVSVGVATALVGTFALRAGVGTPAPVGSMGIAFVTSVLVAGVIAVAWDRVFELIPVAAAPGSSASMAAEDADVDELLRLIATAEDKLASQHTTEKVVMITDMKSFSRMTEEDGSMVTAKAIQRHRDLLLPIISANGGKGKSTGGDGLVAAFDAPVDAARAAVQMQKALAENNVAHPNEREMWVRIGVASGEVVLDKGGRPFIGAALNLAARVMNLADGGQSFATAEIASAASDAGIRTHSFGDFTLKNIAKPTEVVELLAGSDQEPRAPMERASAASPE